MLYCWYSTFSTLSKHIFYVNIEKTKKYGKGTLLFISRAFASPQKALKCCITFIAECTLIGINLKYNFAVIGQWL